MKMDSVTSADLARSVIAVPPLARAADGSADVEENRKIVQWMADGGVSTFLYGGNANFYHLGLGEYGRVLDLMVEIAPAEGWMIPSFGPDFGKAMDQVAVLRSYDFPTAMALPMAAPTRPAGVATGLRRLADAFGRPVTAYLRAENYVAPADMASLLADGAVCAVKYAVERANPSKDRYLSEVVDAIGTERLVSGIGERPAIVHLAEFGLAGFTSGSVAIAPHMSMAILKALKSGDIPTAEALRTRFLPFEEQRDAHSPIVVLHDAVRLAGIADTGPLEPYLGNLADSQVKGVAEAARALYEENTRFVRRQAA